MNYVLNLTAEETQAILNMLAEKPYNQVSPIIDKVLGQINEQRQPQVVDDEDTDRAAVN